MNANKNKRRKESLIQFMAVAVAALIAFVFVNYKDAIANARLLNQIQTYEAVETDEEVIRLYESIPTKVKEDFEDNGWKIETYSQEDLEAIYKLLNGEGVIEGYCVAAFTSPTTKTIYLSSKMAYAEKSVVHEMGHYFDLNISSAIVGTAASGTSYFGSIYTLEAESSGKSEYAASNASEYFAESFRDYIERPWKLKDTSPYTYDYMCALMTAYVTGTEIEDKYKKDGQFPDGTIYRIE